MSTFDDFPTQGSDGRSPSITDEPYALAPPHEPHAARARPRAPTQTDTTTATGAWVASLRILVPRPMMPPLAPHLVAHDDALALRLRPDDPLAVTSGNPRASVLELYRDEVVESGVWEVTPGEFAGENAGFSEHMYVLCGDATVTSEDGATVELRPGVSFVARAGGSWHVRTTVRKIFVIWKVP